MASEAQDLAIEIDKLLRSESPCITDARDALAYCLGITLSSWPEDLQGPALASAERVVLETLNTLMETKNPGGRPGQ